MLAPPLLALARKLLCSAVVVLLTSAGIGYGHAAPQGDGIIAGGARRVTITAAAPVTADIRVR